MTQTLYFSKLLSPNGWVQDAEVRLDHEGNILHIKGNIPSSAAMGICIPGFQNAHSHAFQYAMAGLAEYQSAGDTPDDFWSWRSAMYALALKISPDELRSVAAMLYAEMLRHGYTAVAEFHYLHHDVSGSPYADLAQMARVLMEAADMTGIRLTLVPMFYQMGGFNQPAQGQQRRFLSATPDDYHKLAEATRQAAKSYARVQTGLGVHSLRAVKPEDVMALTKEIPREIPFHIHVSEQLKEVAQSIAFSGKRPVEWLLDHCPVGPNYHLVHATHLDVNEIIRMAQSGANAVICPSTEGNLGDGFFAFDAYQQHGGIWSIGTDSHVGLNPFEELRLLDYGHRLRTHRRTTFTQPIKPDAGYNAIAAAHLGGSRAMGNRQDGFFAPGQPFDAVVLNDQSPLLGTTGDTHLASTIIYTADVSQIDATIVGGEILVNKQQHRNGGPIRSQFSKALRSLGNR